ncbi:helix-turn-helix domain protein [Desulfosporosinus acididurans]|uniref:Helix-turn-helix domain protein n=1 Tax=Desulfosporosinus acididurans TaxID=476652 RepID=A0A0J1FS46_9FIRM|nr:helix-turn-helix transcriptional regulator [Desulfosporosinus acididurans]KLU66107.1 helix-turn-helix domain protein [Desulfosporosinus acididurans]
MSKQKQVVYYGQKLRKARLKAAIGTQKELAEKTGISANIISDLERGKRRMSPSWARRIAEVLGGEWTDYMD